MVKFLNKKSAFTLAEVLVTLGIIGVVLALTIPSLVKNYQRQVYVTQLKKVYTHLTQAAEQAISDNHVRTLDESKYNAAHTDGAENFLTTYFKVTQNCGTTATPCFASEYYYMDGSAASLTTPVIAVTTADGAAISVTSNRFAYSSANHGSLDIQVDINGSQGPNIAGRDLFYIQLYSDGKVAEAYSDEDLSKSSDCLTTNSDYPALGCLSNIISNGWQMDY